MDKEDEDFLFANLENVLMSIIEDKRKNPKNQKTLNRFISNKQKKLSSIINTSNNEKSEYCRN